MTTRRRAMIESGAEVDEQDADAAPVASTVRMISAIALAVVLVALLVSVVNQGGWHFGTIDRSIFYAIVAIGIAVAALIGTQT